MALRVMSDKVTPNAKEKCEQAMKEEHSKTGKTPRFSKLAGELINKNSWKYAPTLLRLKMSQWWDTSSGAGKKRKEKKAQTGFECTFWSPSCQQRHECGCLQQHKCGVTN